MQESTLVLFSGVLAMHKKRSAKHNERDESEARRGRRTEKDTPPQPWARHLTPIGLGLGVGVVALGIALYVGLSGHDSSLSVAKDTRNATTPIARTPVTAWPAATQPAITGFPLAPMGPQSPINNVDPVSGEPITPRSPTITYKGHVVAFCCRNSKGYNGGWERMSETEKDAFIRRWIK